MSITLAENDTVEPAFAENNNLIVFATDDGYAPYCGVAIASIAANASPSQNYDIVILEETLGIDNKKILTSLAHESKNLSIRFFNVKELMEGHKHMIPECWHRIIALIYRILIIKIFPLYDRALYLDCDVIIDSNLVELFAVDFKGNVIAAVKDAFVTRSRKCVRHARNVLLLSEPTKYFNSGVVLFNMTELKKTDFLEDCLHVLRTIDNLPFIDQDILNVVCDGKVLYLNYFWNYYALIRIDQLKNLRERPSAIIHYVGSKKPWFSLATPASEIFWEYARTTPFYEEMV